ncbi:Copper homeostasis protein cutC-like [Pseudocercospora fuligena]|uniref:Copper homeostasis protein cutC homolog n=1 Tax=Pseudocercospora fuligena TaxID=685502 RepID=A0A8H6VKF3_9PEZI|nr:Copper homeostasis protein cutC-like [Pseudocercospora fuligena]
MALLEISCFSVESAILAAQADADRIELCDEQSEGGTTPPQAWITQVKAAVDKPIFVMIRPRGGTFQVDDVEFETMKASIDAFKNQVAGFVFGILDSDDKVDVARIAELVQRAKPLPCTFHKAFDQTPNLLEALEDVVSAGISFVLTSGGAPNALAGMQPLRQLVTAARDRVTILTAGGVRLNNLAQIRQSSGAKAFHSSALDEGSLLPNVEDIRHMKTMLSLEVADSAAADEAVER